VQEDDVTSPVVQYVSDTDEPVFVSVPRLRGKRKVMQILLTEVAMLHGSAARVYGLALSKQGIIGPGLATKLKSIRDGLAAIKEDLT
jgi:hypothetical protein